MSDVKPRQASRRRQKEDLPCEFCGINPAALDIRGRAKQTCSDSCRDKLIKKKVSAANKARGCKEGPVLSAEEREKRNARKRGYDKRSRERARLAALAVSRDGESMCSDCCNLPWRRPRNKACSGTLKGGEPCRGLYEPEPPVELMVDGRCPLGLLGAGSLG